MVVLVCVTLWRRLLP